jgi:hypothetical protein
MYPTSPVIELSIIHHRLAAEPEIGETLINNHSYMISGLRK